MFYFLTRLKQNDHNDIQKQCFNYEDQIFSRMLNVINCFNNEIFMKIFPR